MLCVILLISACGKKDSPLPPGKPDVPSKPSPQPQPSPEPEPLDPCVKRSKNPTLINGEVVNKADFPEIILISSGGARCTATIVGPKTVLTAAHCAKNGATVKFTYKGVSHSAKVYRSKLYPRKDHDVALAFSEKEFAESCPYSIGGVSKKGEEVEIFGYGCTKPGGGGGMDGKLRYGKAEITGFSGYDFVSGKGAALCFGDSGGPAFAVSSDGQKFLLGVNSKGNIKNTNYNTRTDTEASQLFFEMMAKEKNADICGINKNCP